MASFFSTANLLVYKLRASRRATPAPAQGVRDRTPHWHRDVSAVPQTLNLRSHFRKRHVLLRLSWESVWRI